MPWKPFVAFLLFSTAIGRAEIFTVTNTNDSGAGSLRAACLAVNAAPGLHYIHFAIPGTGVKTITPSSPVPTITNPVVIDGYTQPGSRPNRSFSRSDAIILIEISGEGQIATGLIVRDATIRGLAINGFPNTAIVKDGGIDATLIIEGNVIGTDPTGTIAKANGTGIGAAGIYSTRVVVGGTRPECRNVIAGNTGAGISTSSVLINSGTTVDIRGNFIGVDATGTRALPNGAGISISSTSGSVGGGAIAAGNIISGNTGHGVIQSTRTTIDYRGNVIGTDFSLRTPIPNGGSGLLMGSRSHAEIGGIVGSYGNIFAFNGQSGIAAFDGSIWFGNPTFRSQNNIFYSNGFLGVDFGINESGNFPNPNDAGDGDQGPNGLANHPIIESVQSQDSGYRINGTLNSRANTTFTVELFRSTQADPSGYGEGAVKLGEISITTDGNGNAPFSFFTTDYLPGQILSSRIKESEFSPTFVVPGTANGFFQFSQKFFDATENQGTATITVMRLGPTTTPANVSYAAINETATSGEDFNAVSGEMHFAAGETEKSFQISLVNDGAGENDELVRLTLSNPSTGTVLGVLPTAFLGVANDDPLPIVSSRAIRVREGDAGTNFATFTLFLSQAATQPVEVSYRAFRGTATPNADFSEIPSGVVVFQPGETSKPVHVAVLGDTHSEYSETFSLHLARPSNADLAQPEYVATIEDNDPVPTVSVLELSQAEGNAGTSTFNVRISLSGPSDRLVEVSYRTIDGTAVEGADYEATLGTVAFAPGTTEQTVNLSIVADDQSEDDESFFLEIYDPENATLGQDMASIEIGNDDTLVALNAHDVEVYEGNEGSGYFAFAVTLSQSRNALVTVDYSVVPGSAESPSDFETTSGTLTFEPGETTKPVFVVVNGDMHPEPDETVTLLLQNPSGADLGTSTATGTILNDDIEAVPELFYEFTNNELRLSWDSSLSNYVLERTPNLEESSWQPVDPAPVLQGNRYTWTQPPGTAITFYRLRKQE